MAAMDPPAPPAFVLASASPRRRAMLAGAGLTARIRPADVPEVPSPGESPMDFARRAARDKAEVGWRRREPGDPAVVLASDTVVALGDRILGKPATPGEAEAMLRALSERSHEVITAVAVATGPDRTDVEAAVARVVFRALDEEDIGAYVESGEPMDKAGAYGIQGLAGAFVESVEGPYDAVVGLPLDLTFRLLTRAGALPEPGEPWRRLAVLRGRIAAAADAVGRAPADVTLVGVSKTQPVDRIRELLALGQLDFGENYVQEWRAKADALGPGPRWHFIGHLQSNKARLVAGDVAAVHTLDSPSAAEALDKAAAKAGRTLDVLVQVNLGREPQKSGLDESTLGPFLAAVERLSALRLRGLMTVPPVGPLHTTRAHFARLRALREAHRTPDRPLPWLSMGMSGDFDQAIAEGATHVRVGTALFGLRPG